MDSEKKETILFVDDEEGILSVSSEYFQRKGYLSSEYFQRKGYQTLTARTGPEALKILAGQTIDCCFTDINMPDMNGIELAERIRNHDNTMPVIVMTGYPTG
jgi:CheY-like chemotaxis protein